MQFDDLLEQFVPILRAYLRVNFCEKRVYWTYNSLSFVSPLKAALPIMLISLKDKDLEEENICVK